MIKKKKKKYRFLILFFLLAFFAYYIFAYKQVRYQSNVGEVAGRLILEAKHPRYGSLIVVSEDGLYNVYYVDQKQQALYLGNELRMLNEHADLKQISDVLYLDESKSLKDSFILDKKHKHLLVPIAQILLLKSDWISAIGKKPLSIHVRESPAWLYKASVFNVPTVESPLCTVELKSYAPPAPTMLQVEGHRHSPLADESRDWNSFRSYVFAPPDLVQINNENIKIVEEKGRNHADKETILKCLSELKDARSEDGQSISDVLSKLNVLRGDDKVVKAQ